MTTGETRHIKQIYIDGPSMHHCPRICIFKTRFLSACNNVISIINCTCYSVTYMGTRPLNKGTNRPITLCTVKLFIQLMYNKNDHLAKWSIFCQIFDVFFRLYNPFAPLDPRRPLHMLCICIATFNCPKGILGLGGQSI